MFLDWPWSLSVAELLIFLCPPPEPGISAVCYHSWPSFLSKTVFCPKSSLARNLQYILAGCELVIFLPQS